MCTSPQDYRMRNGARGSHRKWVDAAAGCFEIYKITKQTPIGREAIEVIVCAK